MLNMRWRALKIGSGTLLAQAATFLFLPVISRIYIPEEYGKLSILISLAFVLIPLGTLKLDLILVVVKNDDEADNLLKIAMLASLITSIATFPFTLSYFHLVENIEFQDSLFQSFLFSILLLVQCMSILSVQAMLRLRKDNVIVASSIMQNSAIALMQVTLGKIHASGEILITGFILGKIMGILPTMKSISYKIFRVKASTQNLFLTFRRHAKTGTLLISASFFDAASFSMPALIVGILFEIKYAGIIGLTQSVLTVPITLIGGAIGSVILSEIAKSKRENNSESAGINSPLASLAKPLILASISFTFFSILLGPKIFEYFLGESWSESAKLVTWLAIPFGINFLWQPLSNLLYVEGNWQTYLNFSILRFTLSFLFGFSIFFFGFGWVQVTSGFVLGGSLAQLIGIIWIWSSSIKGKLKF